MKTEEQAESQRYRSQSSLEKQGVALDGARHIILMPVL